MLADTMGKEEFSATDGWLSRWIKRESIKFCKLSGEAGSADYVPANDWLKDVWPKLILNYSPNDIYNADETVLYFRAMPEGTFVFKNESAKGVKKMKERMTLLCCVSMTGKKSDLLAIGKSKKPRACQWKRLNNILYFY